MDYIERYHKSYADLRDKLLQGNIASDGRDARGKNEDDGRGENEDDASEREDNEAGVGAEARERDASSESKRDLQGEGSTQIDVHGTEEDGVDEVIDQPREMEKEDVKEDARRERDGSSGDGSNSDNNGAEPSPHPAVVESESGDRFIISMEERQLEVDLLKQLLATIVSFEVEARQMLLDSMHEGVERTILLADRNSECYPSHPSPLFSST